MILIRKFQAQLHYQTKKNPPRNKMFENQYTYKVHFLLC